MWNITSPPVVWLACLFLMVAFHFLLPVSQMVFWPFSLAGVFVFFLGFFLSFSARKQFQKNNTPVRPPEKPVFLMTSGFFSFSRNPIYLGLTISLLGIALFLGSLTAFIFPVIFFLLMNFGFVPFEEKMLGGIFGKKYVEYKKKVRRWV